MAFIFWKMEKQITDILKSFYSIEAIGIKQLVGYDNLNFKIKSKEKKYIFKLFTESNDPHFLQGISDILSLLPSHFPKVISNIHGKKIKEIELDGKKYYIQLLDFLEGTFLGDLEPTEEILSSLGEVLGQLDLSLIHI